MKKSLSILLSIAMAFSIFASVAMGAEANTSVEAKYQALVEAGIFTGDGDDQAANLDHNMTRAQFAAVLVRTFELSEDASASNVYVDLDGAGWASGYIGAVTKAGLMNGRSANEFAPSANVKIEELATVLVRAFDLQQSTSGVTGTVDEWARGYVGAALQAGLISAKADYTVDALRADLVESAYVVYEIILSLQTPEVAFKATSAKTIEVTFSKAVDKDKVTFEVKNSVDAVVGSSVKEWSADNTKATIETNINLLAGVYSIVVKGATAQDLKGSITIEDEKVASIQILSDTAPAVMSTANAGQIEFVNVFFKIVNQYGQDITRAHSVTWQSSLGSVDTTEASNGILKIKLPEQNYVYRVGSEFTLHGYIFGTANMSVNATLKIGDVARAHTIDVIGLYHPTGKTLSIDLANYDDFALLVDVKDQYGNPVKAANIASQVNVFSSNPYLVDVRDTSNTTPEFVGNAGAEGKQIAVKLKKSVANTINMGGTATITFSPVYFANRSVSYDLEVAKASEVVSINIGNPTGVVAVGDKDVLIPVTVLDQNGKEVVKKADASAGVTVQATVGDNPVFEEKDGKLFLKYTPLATHVGPAMISAVVKVNGQMSQLHLNIREEKVPAAVSAMTAVDTTLAGVANTIKGEHFTVLDQYGSAMDKDKFFEKYSLKIVNSTVTDNTYIQLDKKNGVDGETSLTNAAKGNITLTVSAVNKNGTSITKGINNTNYTLASQKDFTLRFVEWADVTDFEVADLAKVLDANYRDGFTANKATVKVTGKTSTGTTVNIGTTANGGHYKVTSSTTGVIVNGDDVTADKAQYGGADIETKGLVLVTIVKPGATKNVTKEIVISKATPVVTSVKLDAVTISAADLNSKNIETGILAKAEFKDQYGTNQAKFKQSATVIVTEISEGANLSVPNGKVLAASDTITGAVAGNKFKITVNVGGHIVHQTVTVN